MASKTKHELSSQETMEEVLSSIKYACELARNFEQELPNMANHPDMLSLSLDELTKPFVEAKEKLTMMMFSQQDQQTTTITPSCSLVPMLLPHDVFQHHETQKQAQMLDQLFRMQQQPFDVRALLENSMVMSGGGDVPQLLRFRDVEGSSERSKEGEMQGVEASPSRPKKSGSRKIDLEKRIVMTPAPLVGNTEMPPEDGFTWRKYGQKEILGSKYPRSYYRCTHQKLYGCPAKKQVQRLDANPNIFQVTYRGDHTCHMSSTAPSSYPPPQLLVNISRDMTPTTISPQLSPTSTSVHGWLSSVNLSRHSGGGTSGGGGSGGGGAGPSTSKYGIDYPVADMADVMFNSGSSSGNSMECLFASAEDKWEAGEKKS